MVSGAASCGRVAVEVCFAEVGCLTLACLEEGGGGGGCGRREQRKAGVVAARGGGWLVIKTVLSLPCTGINKKVFVELFA